MYRKVKRRASQFWREDYGHTPIERSLTMGFLVFIGFAFLVIAFGSRFPVWRDLGELISGWADAASSLLRALLH